MEYNSLRILLFEYDESDLSFYAEKYIGMHSTSPELVDLHHNLVEFLKRSGSKTDVYPPVINTLKFSLRIPSVAKSVVLSCLSLLNDGYIAGKSRLHCLSEIRLWITTGLLREYNYDNHKEDDDNILFLREVVHSCFGPVFQSCHKNTDFVSNEATGATVCIELIPTVSNALKRLEDNVYGYAAGFGTDDIIRSLLSVPWHSGSLLVLLNLSCDIIDHMKFDHTVLLKRKVLTSRDSILDEEWASVIRVCLQLLSHTGDKGWCHIIRILFRCMPCKCAQRNEALLEQICTQNIAATDAMLEGLDRTAMEMSRGLVVGFPWTVLGTRPVDGLGADVLEYLGVPVMTFSDVRLLLLMARTGSASSRGTSEPTLPGGSMAVGARSADHDGDLVAHGCVLFNVLTCVAIICNLRICDENGRSLFGADGFGLTSPLTRSSLRQEDVMYSCATVLIRALCVDEPPHGQSTRPTVTSVASASVTSLDGHSEPSRLASILVCQSEDAPQSAGQWTVSVRAMQVINYSVHCVAYYPALQGIMQLLLSIDGSDTLSNPGGGVTSVASNFKLLGEFISLILCSVLAAVPNCRRSLLSVVLKMATTSGMPSSIDGRSTATCAELSICQRVFIVVLERLCRDYALVVSSSTSPLQAMFPTFTLLPVSVFRLLFCAMLPVIHLCTPLFDAVLCVLQKCQLSTTDPSRKLFSIEALVKLLPYVKECQQISIVHSLVHALSSPPDIRMHLYRCLSNLLFDGKLRPAVSRGVLLTFQGHLEKQFARICHEDDSAVRVVSRRAMARFLSVDGEQWLLTEYVGPLMSLAWLVSSSLSEFDDSPCRYLFNDQIIFYTDTWYVSSRRGRASGSQLRGRSGRPAVCSTASVELSDFLKSVVSLINEEFAFVLNDEDVDEDECEGLVQLDTNKSIAMAQNSHRSFCESAVTAILHILIWEYQSHRKDSVLGTSAVYDYDQSATATSITSLLALASLLHPPTSGTGPKSLHRDVGSSVTRLGLQLSAESQVLESRRFLVAQLELLGVVLKGMAAPDPEYATSDCSLSQSETDVEPLSSQSDNSSRTTEGSGSSGRESGPPLLMLPMKFCALRYCTDIFIEILNNIGSVCIGSDLSVNPVVLLADVLVDLLAKIQVAYSTVCSLSVEDSWLRRAVDEESVIDKHRRVGRACSRYELRKSHRDTFYGEASDVSDTEGGPIEDEVQSTWSSSEWTIGSQSHPRRQFSNKGNIGISKSFDVAQGYELPKCIHHCLETFYPDYVRSHSCSCASYWRCVLADSAGPHDRDDGEKNEKCNEVWFHARNFIFILRESLLLVETKAISLLHSFGTTAQSGRHFSLDDVCIGRARYLSMELLRSVKEGLPLRTMLAYLGLLETLAATRPLSRRLNRYLQLRGRAVTTSLCTPLATIDDSEADEEVNNGIDTAMSNAAKLLMTLLAEHELPCPSPFQQTLAITLNCCDIGLAMSFCTEIITFLTDRARTLAGAYNRSVDHNLEGNITKTCTQEQEESSADIDNPRAPVLGMTSHPAGTDKVSVQPKVLIRLVNQKAADYCLQEVFKYTEHLLDASLESQSGGPSPSCGHASAALHIELRPSHQPILHHVETGSKSPEGELDYDKSSQVEAITDIAPNNYSTLLVQLCDLCVNTLSHFTEIQLENKRNNIFRKRVWLTSVSHRSRKHIFHLIRKYLASCCRQVAAVACAVQVAVKGHKPLLDKERCRANPTEDGDGLHENAMEELGLRVIQDDAEGAAATNAESSNHLRRSEIKRSEVREVYSVGLVSALVRLQTRPDDAHPLLVMHQLLTGDTLHESDGVHDPQLEKSSSAVLRQLEDLFSRLERIRLSKLKLASQDVELSCELRTAVSVCIALADLVASGRLQLAAADDMLQASRKRVRLQRVRDRDMDGGVVAGRGDASDSGSGISDEEKDGGNSQMTSSRNSRAPRRSRSQPLHRLRSRNRVIDDWLAENSRPDDVDVDVAGDTYADLEDFIV